MNTHITDLPALTISCILIRWIPRMYWLPIQFRIEGFPNIDRTIGIIHMSIMIFRWRLMLRCAQLIGRCCWPSLGQPGPHTGIVVLWATHVISWMFWGYVRAIRSGIGSRRSIPPWDWAISCDGKRKINTYYNNCLFSIWMFYAICICYAITSQLQSSLLHHLQSLLPRLPLNKWFTQYWLIDRLSYT